MEYIIYKTTNLINGKFYIGRHKTKNLDDGYLGSGRIFATALKKYGKENFVREILLHCENEAQMHLAEKIFVVLDPMSYNIARGGKEGGFDYVNSKGLNGKNLFTAEQKSRGGLKYAGKHPNLIAARNKAAQGNQAFSGKTHSDETKKKMSASHNTLSHPRGPRGPYKRILGYAYPLTKIAN
jgi:group I intron endonuclease